MKTVTVDQWNAEGVRLFGDKARHWKFLCVACGTVHTGQDFLDAGVPSDKVLGYLGFSCIGRFSDKKGCDWTLGGFFQVHELEVIDEQGKAHPRFEFATPEAVESWHAKNPKGGIGKKRLEAA